MILPASIYVKKASDIIPPSPPLPPDEVKRETTSSVKVLSRNAVVDQTDKMCATGKSYIHMSIVCPCMLGGFKCIPSDSPRIPRGWHNSCLHIYPRNSSYLTHVLSLPVLIVKPKGSTTIRHNGEQGSCPLLLLKNGMTTIPHAVI